MGVMMDSEEENLTEKILKEKIMAIKAFDAGQWRFNFNELYAATSVLLEAYERLDEKLKEQFTPRSMETAPTDGTFIWLLTSNDDWVEGRWCPETEDFYKSQKGWASYDPENCKGTWVANYSIGGDEDRRMYCGMTPNAWMPKLPTLRGKSDEQ